MAIVTEPAPELSPSAGDRGLATEDPGELSRRTLRAWELITEKSDMGATSAPCPADEPSTAVTSGTRPEHCA